MSPDNSAAHNGSYWHTQRSWVPMLSLLVREITSVSATFVLSAQLDESDPSLASLGLQAADLNEADETKAEQKRESSHVSTRRPIIADALAKGLSVNVNGAAWPRAVIKIDDHLDEAVIIIFALMPGRQYDIELGLPHPGQPNATLRRQVTTEEHSDHDAVESTDPESPTIETHSASASSTSELQSTPSTSPSRTAPGTPPSTTPSVAAITLEDRLHQLQHGLSIVNAERETLLASLKSARRDAQKAESALRSEIDTLKRTSEKNTNVELRGKQKVLALQESVKRAQNAAAETDEIAKELQAELPEASKKKKEKEKELEVIEIEAAKLRKQRQELEEKEKKRLDVMKGELAGVTSKLDRLNVKKDRLETSTIPDLEERLKDIEQEILDAEDELTLLEKEDLTRQQLEETYLPYQRARNNSVGNTGIPPQAPLYHPSEISPAWSSTSLQRPTNPNLTHIPRSQSLHTHGSSKHTHTPVILSNPNRQASLKGTAGSLPPGILPNLSILTPGSAAPDTPGAPSSPTRTSPNSIIASSTLSSLAPAFEPSRPITFKIPATVGQSSLQRPTVTKTATTPTVTTTAPPPVGAGRPSRGSTGSYNHGQGYYH